MIGRKFGFGLFGVVFGFTLSRAGASEYDYIHSMFTGRDLHLAFLMGTAIAVGAIGMLLLRWAGNRTLDGEPIDPKFKSLNWGNVTGGMVFGLGWGLAGACPGTVLAQLGEGKVIAMFTVSGLLLGTYVFALMSGHEPRGRRDRNRAGG